MPRPHVNGPAIAYVASPLQFNQAGTPGWTPLGWTEDGFRIEPIHYRKPWHTDSSGSEVPADRIDMGRTVVISGRLIVYDDFLLSTLNAPRFLNLIGLESAVGRPVAMAGHGFAFAIDTGRDLPTRTLERPWRFPCCDFEGAQPITLGTSPSIWQVRIIAWAAKGPRGSWLLFDRQPLASLLRGGTPRIVTVGPFAAPSLSGSGSSSSGGGTPNSSGLSP